MIPTVLKPGKSDHPHTAFKRVVEYVGRDDDEARAKGRQPLTEESCGVFNIEANCGTPEDRDLIWQIMSSDALIATHHRGTKNYRGNPLYHFDVSWMEGEHPTREQLEQTVRHLTGDLEYGKCQTFWAIHRDTDHDHLHVVVNKVILDPDTGEVAVAQKNRFDYRELARLTREIEIAQGWQHAPGYFVAVEPQPGRKEIMPRQEAVGRGLWDKDWQRQKQISNAAGRAEYYMGAESFQAWVALEPAQSLLEILEKSGATWAQAHAVLAEFGVAIELKGSGMVVKAALDDGKILVAKASQLGKWASKASLEKRLGPYAPPSAEIGLLARQAQKNYARAMREQRLGEPSSGNSGTDSDRQARKDERAAARSEAARQATRLGIVVKDADLQHVVSAEKARLKPSIQKARPHGRSRGLER
ncbi:MAG: relaxase/mobilization nuclease domain-containing protein [Burkholderiaceae bacterium]|jgi:hypothetical protein|nr:relaxase/mobilization nuclease domain-containing protein [Burkholderiaceae bacterium]